MASEAQPGNYKHLCSADECLVISHIGVLRKFQKRQSSFCPKPLETSSLGTGMFSTATDILQSWVNKTVFKAGSLSPF